MVAEAEHHGGDLVEAHFLSNRKQKETEKKGQEKIEHPKSYVPWDLLPPHGPIPQSFSYLLKQHHPLGTKYSTYKPMKRSSHQFKPEEKP